MYVQRESRGAIERMDEQDARTRGRVLVNDDKDTAVGATVPVECTARPDFAVTFKSAARDVEARWGNTLRLLEDA